MEVLLNERVLAMFMPYGVNQNDKAKYDQYAQQDYSGKSLHGNLLSYWSMAIAIINNIIASMTAENLSTIAHKL